MFLLVLLGTWNVVETSRKTVTKPRRKGDSNTEHVANCATTQPRSLLNAVDGPPRRLPLLLPVLFFRFPLTRSDWKHAWSPPRSPTSSHRVNILLLDYSLYRHFCGRCAMYRVKVFLGSKVLCALFWNLHSLHFLPLTPLECKFQNKTSTEPLIKEITWTLYNSSNPSMFSCMV